MEEKTITIELDAVNNENSRIYLNDMDISRFVSRVELVSDPFAMPKVKLTLVGYKVKVSGVAEVSAILDGSEVYAEAN